MQPLSNYDLVLNFVIVVMMPLIILANLMNWGASNPVNSYLWREHRNFMRAAMAILTLLTIDAMITLAGHYGLVPAKVVDYAMPVLGIPFLIASVAVVWLGTKALLQYLRSRTNKA
jgi:hypothetical protein